MILLRNRQRGLTLIETLIAVAIAGLMFAFLAAMFQTWMRTTRGQAIGEDVLRKHRAVEAYVQANFAALQQPAPVIAGYANPLAPTMAELRAGRYAVGVQDNAIGGPLVRVLIWRDPAGCVAPNCNLRHLTFLDGPLLTNGRIDYDLLGTASRSGGSILGYSGPVGALNTITGVGNAWTAVNPRGAAGGILAAYGASDTSALSAFLRRDGTTPMLADLPVGNNAITGVTKVDFSNPVTLGAACAPGGSMALYTAGGPGGVGLAICWAGRWQQGTLASNIGTACTVEGAVATHWPDGYAMVCQGGRYVAMRDRLPKIVDIAQAFVPDGAGAAKPACAAGGAANIEIIPINPGIDDSRTPPRNRLQATASDLGALWQVNLKLVDEVGGWNPQTDAGGRPYNLLALVRTTCIYP